MNKVKEMYIKGLAWDFMRYFITHDGKELMGEKSKDTKPIPKPALLGENWNDWNLDLVLRPRSTAKKLVWQGDHGRANVFRSNSDKAVRFERFIAYQKNLRASARPDKALSNRFGSDVSILKSLPNSDPLMYTEILLACLYSLASNYQINEEDILFDVGGIYYKLQGNKIYKLTEQGEIKLTMLENFNWKEFLTCRRRNHYSANPTAYAIHQACERGLLTGDKTLQRVADTVLNVAPKKLLDDLLKYTPERFQEEDDKPVFDWQVMSKLLRAERLGQALLDNVDFTDLSLDKMNTQIVYFTNNLGPKVHLHNKLGVMSRLNAFVCPSKRKENNYVIGFFRESWEW
ncbi:hypothetical protein [Oligella urethralis]|uniref:Uncharacterized protein n=1 Tax=Oligella urethralis TaxID=90245 RepID=A0A2X1UUH5_9BURK|nr:hypothetical protein [Oligella urethralis]SPY08071.1 Uncharacterised protein [Oligella urethralis]